jgi:hypothetical protein
MRLQLLDDAASHDEMSVVEDGDLGGVSSHARVRLAEEHSPVAREFGLDVRRFGAAPRALSQP